MSAATSEPRMPTTRAPMPSPLVPHSNPRKAGLGAFACVVIACVAAPPVVRGAAEPGQIGDSGGCNGGRNIPLPEDGSDTTTADSSTSETSETTSGDGTCGDGKPDPGEACDDGNEADDDACPSGVKGQCKALAGCGDGIVWTGEEACDGGEGCEADCTQTPTECGNGVMEVGEGCDDGNDADDDACPSGATGQCKAEASCGDGITWVGMEVCDDGNMDEADACPSGAVGNCLAEAACGDGFVWSAMEACDDGNKDDTDVCPSGAGACQADATCGDGFVQSDVEDCDDMNGEDLDECNNVCASPRWVFVTSGAGPNTSGNFGGIMGADEYCQTLADAAELPGQYMAWLAGADPASAPATRFASTEFKGWYLMPPISMPTPVALGWADLTSPNEGMPENYLQNAIHFDETGKDVVDGGVWANTRPDGTQDTTDLHCVDWTSNAFDADGKVGRTKAGVVDGAWTAADDSKCGGGNRLYCFQVE